MRGGTEVQVSEKLLEQRPEVVMQSRAPEIKPAASALFLQKLSGGLSKIGSYKLYRLYSSPSLSSGSDISANKHKSWYPALFIIFMFHFLQEHLSIHVETYIK